MKFNRILLDQKKSNYKNVSDVKNLETNTGIKVIGFISKIHCVNMCNVYINSVV